MDSLPSVLLDAGTKALLYGGVILLVGAGAFRNWIAPGLAEEARRPLHVAAMAGAGAILVLSLANLVLVLHSTLGFLEVGILLDHAR